MRTKLGLTQLGVAPNGMSALSGGKRTIAFSSAEIGFVDALTVVVTLTKEAKATNAKTGVTINVDGSPITISSGAIQSNKKLICYILSSPLSFGQTITWSYNASTGNILDDVDNTPLPTTNSRPVTNNVEFKSGPRLAMWVWAYNLKTKANCDAMVTWAADHVTDLFIFAIDDSLSTRTWLGTGTLGNSNATLIDGKTPWKYVYDASHAVGVRVHAWMWLSTFAYWGGSTGLDPNIPNNATYNDGGVWNFHDATARAKMVDEISDFVVNNDLDGINFNHETTTANITEADLTTFMTSLRAAIPNLEFSFCTGASVGDDATLKIDIDGWVTSNLIDTVTLMGYYDDIQTKKIYIDSLPTLGARHLLCGLGTDSNTEIASDLRYIWQQRIADGYTDFALFSWGSNIKNDADIRAVVDDYLEGDLKVVQAAITALSSNSTSFTLVIGGVTETINYADVTDHLYGGPLKKHIEALYGENSEVIYNRINSSSSLRILIGGWEP